jgi:hypothetical protein
MIRKILLSRIGIGLIGNDFNVQNKIPGWENNSIGYHSDDGNIFISKTTGESYGPKFDNNDFIGCCINYIEKVVFFTKNGVALVDFFLFRKKYFSNQLIMYFQQ